MKKIYLGAIIALSLSTVGFATSMNIGFTGSVAAETTTIQFYGAVVQGSSAAGYAAALLPLGAVTTAATNQTLSVGVPIANNAGGVYDYMGLKSVKNNATDLGCGILYVDFVDTGKASTAAVPMNVTKWAIATNPNGLTLSMGLPSGAPITFANGDGGPSGTLSATTPLTFSYSGNVKVYNTAAAALADNATASTFVDNMITGTPAALVDTVISESLVANYV